MAAERIPEEEREEGSEVDIIEPREAVQAATWLDTMYEEPQLASTRANEAASVIQVNKSNN